MYLVILTHPEVSAFALGRARAAAEDALATRGITLPDLERLGASGESDSDALLEAQAAAKAAIKRTINRDVTVAIAIKQSHQDLDPPEYFVGVARSIPVIREGAV